MAKTGLTNEQALKAVKAREIDFVSRFAKNWKALQEVLNIVRPIEREAGTQLRSYTTTMEELQSGAVGEGEEIPYSKATMKAVECKDLTLEKYCKAVSIEAVNKYGPTVAIEKTDKAFLNELQTKVMKEMYDFLKKGELKGTEETFQQAIAMSIGKVKDKFQKMHKDATDIVVFVNTLDVYEYLGGADLTIQTAFGVDYVKDFIGAKTMIISSEVPRNTVIATPMDNIVLYHINPASADFKKLGLDYTTDGETNLIGFHANGNYSTAVGESYALMGMVLWAEYVDAIAVTEIKKSLEA